MALFRWLAIVVLLTIYVVAGMAVLRPKVSPEYRAFFIDHNTSDWEPVRYAGTPEEGFEFSRPGLPDWVESLRGFSWREPAGRWTDAELSRIPGIVFDRKFNGPLCLGFTASAALPQMGKTFGVTFGNKSQTVAIDPRLSAQYQLDFPDVQGAYYLNFILPRHLPRWGSVDPRNGDPRRLGLQLSDLRITPGSCRRPS